jgi:hypothetical protein
LVLCAAMLSQPQRGLEAHAGDGSACSALFSAFRPPAHIYHLTQSSLILNHV